VSSYLVASRSLLSIEQCVGRDRLLLLSSDVKDVSYWLCVALASDCQHMQKARSAIENL
jgi:hypothetical protein